MFSSLVKPLSALSFLMIAGLSLSANAHGDKGHDSGCHDNRCRYEVTRAVSGPANYHPVYAGITSTTVTIDDLRLRTEDGKVVVVNIAPMTINLQDLTGLGKGIALDTTGLTFPDGATSINVAEIEVRIVDRGAALLTSSDATTCQLQVPKRINLYTSAPITITTNDQYLIKVPFSPLASIQLDVITETIKKVCGKDGGVVSTETRTKNACSLANRRQAITNIVRRVDEF